MKEFDAWSTRRRSQTEESQVMELPLFPLNVVLFPGMVLPLHIFEPRYREMINHCIEEELPFGVVLLKEGQGKSDQEVPYAVGTAAKIVRYERHEDGRLDITTVGAQRFKILELDRSRSYLVGKVSHFPIVNGGTRVAQEMMQQVRPKVITYVELLSQASKTELKLERLPEDPTALAFLVAIALQVKNPEKQRLLELAGIPEMLDRERYLLSWEALLLQFMVETQEDINAMSGGPTGYIFPN